MGPIYMNHDLYFINVILYASTYTGVQYHMVFVSATVSISNGKIVERVEINTHNKQIHDCSLSCFGVRVMVFNATFNNILVISWQSVILMEETGENHRPAGASLII
jgi:hypothetical protein